MTEKLNVRQICFIMLIYTAVTKLIIYPTALSYYCGRDLLISAALNLAAEGAVIWAVSFLCSRTDKTFFSLLAGSLGNAAARVIYGLFGIFFMLCAIVPLFEHNVYVHAVFYDTVPSVFVFLPFFAFAAYAASKGFNNIGRCADICMPLFAISMVSILSMSLPEVKWDNFLPVLTAPKRALSGSLYSLFRFFGPCYMLMFMGRFSYRKGDAAKITLSYAGGAAVVLIVLAAFYGIYGDIAPSRQFAISKISLFFSPIDAIGRVDLIALYVLEIPMLFALALNIQLAVHCVSVCTGYNNLAIISSAVSGALALVLVFFKNKFGVINSLWSDWMWILIALFAYAVPVLCHALRCKNA